MPAKSAPGYRGPLSGERQRANQPRSAHWRAECAYRKTHWSSVRPRPRSGSALRPSEAATGWRRSRRRRRPARLSLQGYRSWGQSWGRWDVSCRIHPPSYALGRLAHDRAGHEKGRNHRNRDVPGLFRTLADRLMVEVDAIPKCAQVPNSRRICVARQPHLPQKLPLNYAASPWPWFDAQSRLATRASNPSLHLRLKPGDDTVKWHRLGGVRL